MRSFNARFFLGPFHQAQPSELGLRLAVLGCVLATTAAFAAPVKKVVRKPTVAPVEKETVFVSMPTARPEPVEAPPPLPVRNPSKPSPSNSRPLPLAREGGFAYGGSVGIYQAEVLGANPFAQAYADWFPLDAQVFFQFSGGIGTVQSAFSQDVVGADVFDHSWMLAFEALGGYGIDLSGRVGHGASRGLNPYLVAGMTAIWQGGVPNFGGVIGYGHRFPVPFMTRNERWAMALMIKDHIYSQKIRTTPSVSQNLVLTLGLQRYF